MLFKSQTQPLCRYCGQKLRKRTQDLYCYEEAPQTSYTNSQGGQTSISVPRHRVGVFRDKASLQKVVNEEIVSIKRSGDRIRSATTWDGESYEDEFFCSGSHAQFFARLMAKEGYQTKAHQDAVAAAKVEEQAS